MQGVPALQKSSGMQRGICSSSESFMPASSVPWVISSVRSCNYCRFIDRRLSSTSGQSAVCNPKADTYAKAICIHAVPNKLPKQPLCNKAGRPLKAKDVSKGRDARAPKTFKSKCRPSKDLYEGVRRVEQSLQSFIGQPGPATKPTDQGEGGCVGSDLQLGRRHPLQKSCR